jgi:dipeptidyl aminopeptidase/acylaminoacyl peptidase
MKTLLIQFLIFGIIILIVIMIILFKCDDSIIETEENIVSNNATVAIPTEKIPDEILHPMSIESLRQREYPGGDFTIEETLPDGTNYRQFIVSYRSEGLKIYGLMTIPVAPRPENGYPAVIFVHGYIPPKQYSTTGNYPSYQATLARAGFITFKPDLRGHGNSEGEPVSAHYSEKYIVDVLYAISFMKNSADIDPERIGYWGHSNGGEIGLRTVILSPDIKAAVFWAGVVGSFKDMFETYNAKIPFLRDADESPLVKEHGLPSQNPAFWDTIEPYSYLSDISAPIELHHGTEDISVPIELSARLNEELVKQGKKVNYFEYTGDDHNIGNNSGLAWQRSIRFFKENL